MMFRRLALLIVGWALLATARGSSNGPTTAALPADPQLIPEFTLAEYKRRSPGCAERRCW
jgi:hypothetical protein